MYTCNVIGQNYIYEKVYRSPNDVSQRFSTYTLYSSLCETSCVTGQCQAKLDCDWQKFWVYLSQCQITFVKFGSMFNDVTGNNYSHDMLLFRHHSQIVMWYENSFRIDCLSSRPTGSYMRWYFLQSSSNIVSRINFMYLYVCVNKRTTGQKKIDFERASLIH